MPEKKVWYKNGLMKIIIPIFVQLAITLIGFYYLINYRVDKLEEQQNNALKSIAGNAGKILRVEGAVNVLNDDFRFAMKQLGVDVPEHKPIFRGGTN